jgi:hypothetical protein
MKNQIIASASIALFAIAIGISAPARAETNASGATVCPPGQMVDSGTTQCVAMPRMGLGFDLKFAGSTREEHARFHKGLAVEDQQYIASICQLSYKNRTEQEKTYCADIQ